LARSRGYKKLEKNAVSHLLHLVNTGFTKVLQFCKYAFRFLDQKFTIVIVPHSQAKVFNFQTNVFAMICTVVIVFGVTFSFVHFNKVVSGSGEEISRLKSENRETLASLDELRDENNNLLQTAKRFQTTLNQSLSLLGVNQNSYVNRDEAQNKDISTLFDTEIMSSNTLKETNDIHELNTYLAGNIQSIEQIGKMLQSQNTLFSDIPSIWPIKGGIGHISMAFGQNVHPIYGTWYIHKGIDFSTYRIGDPIVATANGQVVTVGYTQDFGNYVIIQHKHGIYTRYAHMNTVIVRKGQQVTQHQVIGTIGNSGLTTGPHLHYEVHVGSDVVDPAKYINSK
jgi:murein DD-endopeptidase MepM/ murein hydrolase activator NlpD